MAEKYSRSQAIHYVIWGVVLWFFVDLGTAGGFRISYLIQYGQALWIFYIGFPLLFGYLIYRRRWQTGNLILATLGAIAIVEGLFTRNPLVLSFPILLVGIPLAVCVYLPLTFFPLWIVNREMGNHKIAVGFLSTILVVISLLTTFGKH